MVAIMQPQAETNRTNKMRGTDRVFTLEMINPDAPPGETGLVDRRLFTGRNKLHAMRDEGSGFLWYFKYEHGELPDGLKDQRFTNFGRAREMLEKYFNTRNIKIKEVID